MVESLLSLPDAIAALDELNRDSSTSYAETLQVELVGANVVARYRRARSDMAFNAIMNSLRCTFHGHIDIQAGGSCLRGRFALPWLHVAMTLIGLAIVIAFLPSMIMQASIAFLLKIAAPIVFYCLVAVPVARADIPYIERNLRYALTGSNDGG